MTEQEKLRDRLRSFYDAQQFTPSSEDWEKTLSTYHAERTKKKRRALFYITTLILTGLLSIGYLYKNLSVETDLNFAQVDPVRLNTKPLKNGNSENTINQNAAIVTRSLNLPSKFMRPREKTETFNSTQNTKPVVKSSALKTLLVKGAHDSTEIHESVLTANPLVSLQPFNSDTLISTLSVFKNQDRIENKRTEEESKWPDLKQKDQGVSNAIESNSPLLKDSLLDLEVPSGPPTLIVKTEPSEFSFVNGVDKGLDSSQQITSEVKNQQLLPLISLNKMADTAEQAVIDSSRDLNLNEVFIREALVLELGTSYLYGWTNSGRDAAGFSPLIGINYTKQLGRKLGLSIGANYFQVRNLASSSKIFKIANYTYGENSSVTKITPVSLYYINFPLRMSYHIKKQQSLGIGLNLAYLVNVEAKVSTYQQSPGYVGAIKTERQIGYLRGFSWFDSQVQIFYRRRINKIVGFQTELFFGLKDVKQDAFFNVSGKERNSGAKVSLIVYLNSNFGNHEN